MRLTWGPIKTSVPFFILNDLFLLIYKRSFQACAAVVYRPVLALKLKKQRCD